MARSLAVDDAASSPTELAILAAPAVAPLGRPGRAGGRPAGEPAPVEVSRRPGELAADPDNARRRPGGRGNGDRRRRAAAARPP